MDSVSRAEPPPARTTSGSTAGSNVHVLRVEDLLGQVAHHRRRHQPERVMVRPRPDRRDDLLRLGRREDELQVRRRLLDELEQGVEALLRHHVRLVDDVDLESRRRRGRRRRARAGRGRRRRRRGSPRRSRSRRCCPGPDGASATHESHTPHGSGVGPLTQFRDLARMRALDVLPQPRGPLNRYAWLIRPLRSAWRSGSVTCSWPRTSAKVAGRYLRYRARDCLGRSPDHLRACPRPVARGPGLAAMTGSGILERRGTPRAPVRARVPLLPSGPGGVGEVNAARGVGLQV